jgi:hypothetical protein
MATEGAMCGVNDGEGGQRSAWYYHFIENFYRMVLVHVHNLGLGRT